MTIEEDCDRVIASFNRGRKPGFSREEILLILGAYTIYETNSVLASTQLRDRSRGKERLFVSNSSLLKYWRRAGYRLTGHKVPNNTGKTMPRARYERGK